TVQYYPGDGLNNFDTVGYIGPATPPVVVTGLQSDSLYYFAVYGLQTCNGVYSLTASTDSARTYCTGGVANVSDLVVRYSSANAIGLTLVGPSSIQYAIIFSLG